MNSQPAGATAANVNVVCNTSAHTKGAWTELIASTTADADLLLIVCGAASSGVNSASLLDIGIGASGSETALCENIAVGGMNGGSPFPIIARVPSGSRISARAQSVVTGGRTLAVGVFLQNTNSYTIAPTSVPVLGSSTATSLGTNVNSTNTEIIASLDRTYSSFIVVPSVNTSSLGNSTQTFTLCVGAAGEEVDVGSIEMVFSSAENVLVRNGSYCLINGPFGAGTRIAGRFSSSTDDGEKSVCLIGLPFL